MPARSFSMSAGAPNPLITILAPAPAKARAHASPMPLVEPVTTAVLPVNVPISFLLFKMTVAAVQQINLVLNTSFLIRRLPSPFFGTDLLSLKAAEPRTEISGIKRRQLRDSSSGRCPGTVTSRQSGIAAAITLRSAGAIQPSFSPHSTRCGCLISGIRRSSSLLSRSRLRLKGVPIQMPSETPKVCSRIRSKKTC